MDSVLRVLHDLGMAAVPFMPMILAGAAAWIARHVSKPSDLQRAQLLATLARDTAAWAQTTYPGKSWPEYVALVADALGRIAGVPTKDATILKRAAASALAERGLAPPA